jgi:hypothetical protein
MKRQWETGRKVVSRKQRKLEAGNTPIHFGMLLPTEFSLLKTGVGFIRFPYDTGDESKSVFGEFFELGRIFADLSNLADPVIAVVRITAREVGGVEFRRKPASV